MDEKVRTLSTTKKRYISKELSYDNGKHMISHMFILLKGNTFEVEDTPFSRFFMSKDIINLSIETKYKTYARIITPFLNYVLIDSPDKIDDISELTYELGRKFMEDYATGELERIKKRLDEPEYRSPGSITKCELALTRFIKWLCYSRDAGIKMKYIKRSIFDGNKSIFGVYAPPKEERKRLGILTPYLVTELISVAQEHDPMIALGITLQAFVGLRAGDICQMADHRFVWICSSWDFITDEELLKEIKEYIGTERTMNAYINFEQEYVLRRDGIRTSGIKIHRKQPIFEPFLSIIRNVYMQHMEMLKDMGINNKYNAIFVNEYGTAMQEGTYLNRFEKVCNLLLERLTRLAPYNELAGEALSLLQLAPLGTHSLRYFYTNQIGRYIPTVHMLAYYRGDRSLSSAMTYLALNPSTTKFIRDIQDGFEDDYKKILA